MSAEKSPEAAKHPPPEALREAFTPTAILSLFGSIAGIVGILKGNDELVKASIISLAVVSAGGTAIALWEHVTESAREQWWIPGIVRSFRRKPEANFWRGLLTHLPQGLLALLLLLRFLKYKK